MLRVWSVLFWTIIIGTCPVFFLGALLLWAVTAPFDRRRVLLHLYSSAWAVCYIRVNPLWRLRTSGRRLLPWRGAAVLVANHASLIDILVLFDLFRPFKWVSKMEVLAPLDPSDFADAGALRDAAHRILRAALGTPAP